MHLLPRSKGVGMMILIIHRIPKYDSRVEIVSVGVSFVSLVVYCWFLYIQFTVSKTSISFETGGLVQIKTTLNSLKVFSKRR